MGDLSRYDGRKPEPPYPTPDDDLDAIRAQLTEKDREIERLTAEIQMITAPVEAGAGVVANLRADLPASQARERELEAHD